MLELSWRARLLGDINAASGQGAKDEEGIVRWNSYQMLRTESKPQRQKRCYADQCSVRARDIITETTSPSSNISKKK